MARSRTDDRIYHPSIIISADSLGSRGLAIIPVKHKIMIPSSSPSGAKPFAFQIAYAEEDAARRDVERVVSFLSAHRRNIGTTTGRLKSRN
jgi:hypothetical protein